MKKYFVFAFSFLFLLSGAFLLTTDARSSFQNLVACRTYQNCQELPLRTFSGLKAPYAFRLPSIHRLRFHNDVSFTHPSMRANTHLYPEYRPGVIPYRDQKLLRRLKSPELYPRYMNEHQSGVNIVRNGDYKVAERLDFDATRNTYVYTPTIQKQPPSLNASAMRSLNPFKESLSLPIRNLSARYSFDLPYGFSQMGNVYRSPKTSLAFRVVENKNTPACEQLSFEMCAVDYGKSFIRQQDLTLQSSIKKIVSPRQTVRGSFEAYPAVSQAFYAHGFGTDNVYFLFSVFHPQDGSTLHIEAVSQRKDAESSAVLMERLYQSFRFNF